MASRPDTHIQGENQSDLTARDEQLGKLLSHCERIPDPREVFELLDLLREMGALTADECAMLLHLYWQGQE